MKRKLEAIDVLVAIGMVATLFGGYLVYTASYGGALAVTTSSTPMTTLPMKFVMQTLLQPALGQAIVDQTILERRFAKDMTAGARRLTRATLALNGKPRGGLDRLEARLLQSKADHAAHGQWVMGKTIVNLTGQGVRAGVLSADNLSNPFADRIVSTAKAKGDVMEGRFAQNWQRRLGEWIVDAAKREWRFAGHVQEQIGRGVVNVATVQDRYVAKRAGLHNQYQALVAAWNRTASDIGLMAGVSRADSTMQRALGVSHIPDVGSAEAWMWPEIPFGYLMAAGGGLMAVFLLGFLFPVTRNERDPEEVMGRIQELTREVYRKAG